MSDTMNDKWERLKEFVRKDIGRCDAFIAINKYGDEHGWVMAKATNEEILDEILRLEKEE